jgi:CRP-like cAMP-binding protein
MNNYNDEGRSLFKVFLWIRVLVNSSLFLDRTYPANAEAVEDSELLCISKNNFWN